MVLTSASRFAFAAALAALAAVACTSSSGDTPSTPSGGDGGSADAGASPADAGASSPADASTTDAPAEAAATAGFQVTNATNTALVGAYDLQLDKFVNGAETAYNGALPETPQPGASKPRIEMEVVTDDANKVKRAHFWNYDASGSSVDKTYGCDGSATLPCTGVTVDPVKKVVSFASVTWKEVTPDLTGATPDVVVNGGGTVTLAGDVTVK